MQKVSGKESSYQGSSFLKNVVRYMIGLAVGAAFAALVMLGFSLLLTINSIPDSAAGIFGYICMAFAALVAGFVATLLIRSKGLLNGAITGLLFFAVHTIVSFAVGSGQIFSVKMLIFLLIEMIPAAIGGILSVNIRK